MKDLSKEEFNILLNSLSEAAYQIDVQLSFNSSIMDSLDLFDKRQKTLDLYRKIQNKSLSKNEV